MGKRFITRSRQEWEAFLQPDSEDVRPLKSRASLWLSSMLEQQAQADPGAPITLAVPDRFLQSLGDGTGVEQATEEDDDEPSASGQ